MTIQKLKYGDKFIYVDDSEVDIKDTGIIIRDDESELDKTIEIEPIDEKDLFEDTIIDLKGIKEYE